jgi:hypothetical protein
MANVKWKMADREWNVQVKANREANFVKIILFTFFFSIFNRNKIRMNKNHILFLLAFVCIQINAQVLFGTRWTGTNEIFSTQNANNNTINDFSTIQGADGVIQGESALDVLGARYFNITNVGISIINVQSGNIIDTIALTSKKIQGLEFDASTGQLIGTYRNGSNWIYTRLDPSTKTYTDLATLAGASSIVQGETAYDAANKIYYNYTNIGIMKINALTGAVLDTMLMTPSNRIKGLEFDPNSGNIFCSHWTGSVEVFQSLDPNTKAITTIDTLIGVEYLAQGVTTYDPISKKYFNKTNLGVTIIDSQTGTIIDTLNSTVQLKNFEVNTDFIQQISFFDTNIALFPNPVESSATIVLKEPETNLDFVI